MGMLARFKDIMASNVNALLDRSEDPEKTIDEYMKNVNSDLGKIKAETAALLADESRAKRALDEAGAEIRKLQTYAERSVAAGNDDDARKFLERKATQTERQAQLQQAYDSAAAKAAYMRQMQDKLMTDQTKLEARRTELKSRIEATRTQQKQNSAGSSIRGNESAFRAAEEKVNQAYHEAMAIAELRAEPTDNLDELFAEFEKSMSQNSGNETNTAGNGAAAIDDELAALKQQVNKS